MGTVLSGGQKQRILLARALYKRPKILFLDEATCHLDIDRERKLVAAIGALRITRVMVAHRPQTIASADRVIVLSEGVVANNCPPSELRFDHEDIVVPNADIAAQMAVAPIT